jgi:hypothetical protein
MVPAATALAQTAARPRVRAGFFYIPHGAVQFDTKFGPEGDRWTPSGAGASYKLNAITQPLEPFKRYVSTIGNLENAASAGSVHVRNPGSWLNCSTPTTTIDQIIARRIGQQTALPSLEVAAETTVQQAAGNGTATAITLSFRDTTPLPMEYNPKKVFNTLFGTTTPKERVLNTRESDSLLDLILDRARTFQSELGAADRAAFEQYLDSVREIERRIAIVASTDISSMKIPERPVGVNDEFRSAGRSALRSDGGRLPGRPDPRRVLHHGCRGHEPDLQVHRRRRLVPSRFASCQRTAQDGARVQDSALAHGALRRVPEEDGEYARRRRHPAGSFDLPVRIQHGQ